MKVVWTGTAIRHLRSIHDYIAQDSQLYGRQMIDRLTRRADQIAEFPSSGRMVPEFARQDIREIVEPPYRIIYRLRGEQIDILAVVHGARRLPPSV